MCYCSAGNTRSTHIKIMTYSSSIDFHTRPAPPTRFTNRLHLFLLIFIIALIATLLWSQKSSLLFPTMPLAAALLLCALLAAGSGDSAGAVAAGPLSQAHRLEPGVPIELSGNSSSIDYVTYTFVYARDNHSVPRLTATVPAPLDDGGLGSSAAWRVETCGRLAQQQNPAPHELQSALRQCPGASAHTIMTWSLGALFSPFYSVWLIHPWTTLGLQLPWVFCCRSRARICPGACRCNSSQGARTAQVSTHRLLHQNSASHFTTPSYPNPHKPHDKSARTGCAHQKAQTASLA